MGPPHGDARHGPPARRWNLRPGRASRPLMRFTLDTNILVYAIDLEAGQRHRIALDLVRRARGRDCVVTLPALAELFRTLTRRHRIPGAKAAAVVEGGRDAVPIFAADALCLVATIDAVIGHGCWSW